MPRVDSKLHSQAEYGAERSICARGAALHFGLDIVGRRIYIPLVTQKSHSSFRLSDDSKRLLAALALHHRLTKTAMLELLIREKAQKVKK